ncbi:MAG TPA: hypothetical protein VNM90_20190 [Haliangium sp.]|nr:hypothetical protein [Haliangium sp.]
MHRSACFTLSALSSLLLASLLVAGCDTSELAVDQSDEKLRIVAPEARDLPEDARVAIEDAIARVQGVDAVGAWSLVGLRRQETWALATLTSAELDQPLADGEETHLGFDNLHALLLIQTERGWDAALEDDARVHQLLARVPESELGPEARSAMFPRPDEVRASVYAGYKFFWPSGNAWRVTQGWHDNYTWGGQFPAGTSLDFDITGATNSDILAGAPGTVSYVCNDGTQVLLGITTSGTSEKLGYLHLSSSSVAAQGIGQGSTISMGTKLGRMLASDGTTISTSCGTSIGTHVHMYLPSQSITIDGVTFSSSNTHLGENLFSSQGSGSTPSEVIVDDTSAGFTKFGPSEFWWQAAIGHGSHMWYTFVNGSTQSNYARWQPSLPGAGNYTIYVFVPSNHATSQQARYRIFHNGASHYATVNQNAYYDAWVNIGVHYFSAAGGEYVELGDATGEAASTSRKIGFDAVKFVR